MRSTEGVYHARLDHLRAFAAYLVFLWHFLHMTDRFPVPYASAPIFPFALLDEGHTGVALFMTLSGYLFARLVGDRHIDFGNFLWSRTMRLAPLLIVCLAAWTILSRFSGAPLPLSDLLRGFVLPIWPNGAWSVSIELQFYLLFPLLLAAMRRYGPIVLLTGVAIALLVRADWWLTYGEAQHISYWTIFGRIDQFLLGMLFARASVSRRTLSILSAVSLFLFLLLWHEFDRMGGYHNRNGTPSTSPLWIVIPTIEAITWGSLIAWYDGSSVRLPAWLDDFLAKIGTWSYSIYLLHFFPIVVMHNLFATWTGSAETFFPALFVANIAFLLFLPVARLSYVYFESFFLAFRRPYLRPAGIQDSPAFSFFRAARRRRSAT